MELNEKELTRLRDALLGTSGDAGIVTERLELLPSCSIDTTDIESQLADTSLERCSVCDVWCDVSELVANIDIDVCVDCFEDMKEANDPQNNI